MAIKFYSLEGLYREYICVLSLLFQRTLNEKILVRENCTFSSANKNLIIIYLFEENFPSLNCKSNKCVFFIFENIQRGYLFLHLLHKPQNQYQAVMYFSFKQGVENRWVETSNYLLYAWRYNTLYLFFRQLSFNKASILPLILCPMKQTNDKFMASKKTKILLYYLSIYSMSYF